MFSNEHLRWDWKIAANKVYHSVAGAASRFVDLTDCICPISGAEWTDPRVAATYWLQIENESKHCNVPKKKFNLLTLEYWIWKKN